MSQVRRDRYTTSYIDGNTVRQPEPQKRRRVYRGTERIHESERQIRARESTIRMNAANAIFLVVVSVACLLMCVGYLYVQSEITQTRSEIASLKNQINTVASQNDALNYTINSYMDTEHIYKVATKKMGMKKAKDKQISLYKKSDSGYTVQYGDIPKE